MGYSSVLWFVLIVAGVLQAGESLQCYKCSSFIPKVCGNPLNTSNVEIKTCSSNDECFLMNITDKGLSHVTRDCAPTDYCSRIRDKRRTYTYTRACKTCNWDLCNASTSISSAFGIGIVSLFLIKFGWNFFHIFV